MALWKFLCISSLLECKNGENDKASKKKWKNTDHSTIQSTQKQIIEIKKSIHGMDEKFLQDIKILKRTQTEILEVNNSIC